MTLRRTIVYLGNRTLHLDGQLSTMTFQFVLFLEKNEIERFYNYILDFDMLNEMLLPFYKDTDMAVECEIELRKMFIGSKL